jgi:hypothetical protein
VFQVSVVLFCFKNQSFVQIELFQLEHADILSEDVDQVPLVVVNLNYVQICHCGDVLMTSNHTVNPASCVFRSNFEFYQQKFVLFFDLDIVVDYRFHDHSAQIGDVRREKKVLLIQKFEISVRYTEHQGIVDRFEIRTVVAHFDEATRPFVSFVPPEHVSNFFFEKNFHVKQFDPVVPKHEDRQQFLAFF